MRVRQMELEMNKLREKTETLEAVVSKEAEEASHMFYEEKGRAEGLQKELAELQVKLDQSQTQHVLVRHSCQRSRCKVLRKTVFFWGWKIVLF